MDDKPTTPTQQPIDNPLPHAPQVSLHQKRHLNSLTKFVLFIIIIVLCSGGIYYWQHKKVNNLDQHISNLNSQVSKLNVLDSKLSAQIKNETTTNTTSESVNACSTNDMSLTINPTSGAAGNEGAAVVLTNTSKQTCTLYGYPIVQYYDASGTLVTNVNELLEGGMIFGNPPQPTVITLAPNQTASSGLSYTEGGSNSSSAVAMKVFLPGQSTGLSFNKAFGHSTANTEEPFNISVTSLQLGTSPKTNQ